MLLELLEIENHSTGLSVFAKRRHVTAAYLFANLKIASLPAQRYPGKYSVSPRKEGHHMCTRAMGEALA